MNIFLILLLTVMPVAACVYENTTEQEYPGDGVIDPNFYNINSYWLNGHMWRPIVLQHADECPCHYE